MALDEPLVLFTFRLCETGPCHSQIFGRPLASYRFFVEFVDSR